MRIPFIVALLSLTAACAPPPELAAPFPAAPAAAAPAPPTALMPAAPPTPAPAPPPAVVAAPAPPTVDYVPVPLLWARGFNQPPPAGRLTLSNFTFDKAHVQTVITSGPDCGPRDGTIAAEFMLPLNGTRIIATPPGADVCWRHEAAPDVAQRSPGAVHWTDWNRAYTSSGRYFDSRL